MQHIVTSKTTHKLTVLSSQVKLFKCSLHDGVFDGTEHQLDIFRVCRPPHATQNTHARSNMHRTQASTDTDHARAAPLPV